MGAPVHTHRYFPIGTEVYVRDKFFRVRHCRVTDITIWIRDGETRVDHGLKLLDETEEEKGRTSSPLYAQTPEEMVFATLPEAQAECKAALAGFRGEIKTSETGEGGQ